MSEVVHIGDVFGVLTVHILPFRCGKTNRVVVTCQCICGNQTTVRLRHLLIQRVKSCGCLRKTTSAKNGQGNKKHGRAHGPEWKSYYAMLDRCYKPSHAAYKDY